MNAIKNDGMEKLLTLEEVALMLRVSERTVLDWASKGEIPGGKIGTSWRFQEGEIEQWVKAKLSPRIKQIHSHENLSSLLTLDRIHITDFSSKHTALDFLVEKMTLTDGLKQKDEIGHAIKTRESIMSTGIGLGIAVPHCRLGSIKKIYLSMLVNSVPINDYESLDNNPVRIIIMIVAGRDQHSEYIKVLSQFSQILKEEDIRLSVLQAASVDEIYSILTGETSNA